MSLSYRNIPLLYHRLVKKRKVFKPIPDMGGFKAKTRIKRVFGRYGFFLADIVRIVGD